MSLRASGEQESKPISFDIVLRKSSLHLVLTPLLFLEDSAAMISDMLAPPPVCGVAIGVLVGRRAEGRLIGVMTKLYSAAPEAVRCGVRSEAETERSGDGAERCGVRSGGINNGAWNWNKNEFTQSVRH